MVGPRYEEIYSFSGLDSFKSWFVPCWSLHDDLIDFDFDFVLIKDINCL